MIQARPTGPFGFGWSVHLPAVTRKTSLGLPQYNDAKKSDIRLLSDTEDLMPALLESKGQWSFDISSRSLYGNQYSVQRYRPRVEGPFRPHCALGQHFRQHRRVLADDFEGQYYHLVRADCGEPHRRSFRPDAHLQLADQREL